MEHIFIIFKVKKDKIEEAKKLIKEFVPQIKEHEPGTTNYKCFQEKSDETSFIHIITFKDEAAEEYHRRTEYAKNFVDKLYPICEAEPEFSELNLICSN